MNEREIFIAALDIADEAERGVYLAHSCGDDAALRERVDDLLRAHAAPGNFMANPATAGELTGLSATPGLSEDVGSLVAGKYKLVQQLGEGGMGAVWVAEQSEPIKRRVALKLIKPGMDSALVLRRFDAERQALAMMDHINIAKVFDAGTTNTGRPFFVMELVKGVPITKYCDELSLSLRERLELFVPVCKAIQHAHQKGIIHRDLKPSNVLVAMTEGKPVAKVKKIGSSDLNGTITWFTADPAIFPIIEYNWDRIVAHLSTHVKGLREPYEVPIILHRFTRISFHRL